MVMVVPAGDGFVLPDSRNEIANRISARPRRSRARQARLLELRSAIEGGDYRVPAADLADALLHAAHSAN
jgi:anti-sigma28 factor (negative regulator of flagellin synthesis)